MPATPTTGDSDSDRLTTTERISTTDKLTRERETETVDIGTGLDTPNHEMTPIAGDEKVVTKKDKPPLDSNVYSTKKTVAQGMMDLALLTANASQLKMLLKYSDQRGQLFAAHVTCLSLSIILQIIVGILLILKSRYNINRISHHSRADRMNNITVIGIFLITVLNILASSFDEGRVASVYDERRILSAFDDTGVASAIDENRIALPFDEEETLSTLDVG